MMDKEATNAAKDVQAATTMTLKAAWTAPQVRSLDAPDVETGSLFELPESEPGPYGGYGSAES